MKMELAADCGVSEYGTTACFHILVSFDIKTLSGILKASFGAPSLWLNSILELSQFRTLSIVLAFT
jgi:hypothetical protein